MPDGPLGIVSDYLHRVAAAVEPLTDAELLRRYADRKDSEAFALLVHRHGPMVLGVCRRALAFRTEADDAFQATFLALARQAGKVKECVPGWLYRVAVRTARKARSRLPVPEREPANDLDPFALVEWRDVRRVLDEELNRLPAKWRTPLVLCYLEGLTRDEAAAQLKCSLRTLHRNLAEGRTRLRERLVRRGVTSAGLADAVLAAEGLRAAVPAPLFEKTVALSGPEALVPSAVRKLLAQSTTMRGLAMKIVSCGFAITAGALIVVNGRDESVAAPPPAPAAPAILVSAPIEKNKPAADPLGDKVKEAQAKAIKYLRAQQKENSKGVWNWEGNTLAALQSGGSSCLAILALLESGLTPEDKTVVRGMKYLRTLVPQHNTYVVSLQTLVYCKANQKEDAKRIKSNVEWLEKAAVWNGKNLEGWSYTASPGARADNSNTRYAIAALYAAHEVGFKVKANGFWRDVLNLYTRTQKADGGWGYVPDSPRPTHTMTLSGLLGTTLASELVGKEDKVTAAAIKAAREWIANEFRMESPGNTFYNLDLIAAVGRATERKFVGEGRKKRDWYKEGAEWLLKNQKVGGEWQIKQGPDDLPIISTSFALRFLASRPD